MTDKDKDKDENKEDAVAGDPRNTPEQNEELTRRVNERLKNHKEARQCLTLQEATTEQLLDEVMDRFQRCVFFGLAGASHEMADLLINEESRKAGVESVRVLRSNVASPFEALGLAKVLQKILLDNLYRPCINVRHIIPKNDEGEEWKDNG